MDYESSLLSQRILNEFQINEIRTNFIRVLGINKTHFGLNEFTNLIYQLVENNQVQNSLIGDYFKIFDCNNDQKLDWNEYLIQFKHYIDKVQCLRYLKSLSSLEEQSQYNNIYHRYLSQLQIAFLASPFRLNFPTSNLLKVEQTLIQLESTSSNKHIKKYYFICKDIIETARTSLPLEIFAFQDFNNLAAQIFIALRQVIAQRLPHVKIYLTDYVNHLITEIISKDYFDHLYKLLFLEDEKDQLQGLHSLTLLIATFNIFQIQLLFPYPPETIIETILNLLGETENDLIFNQCYLLMGHLVLYDKAYRQILLKRRTSIIDFQIINDEQLLYHSWFIGCLFFRYERNYGQLYIETLNQLPDNLLWLQSLINYYSQYGMINRIENNQIIIQIQINMLIVISPILSTQIHQEILYHLIDVLQNPLADNRYKLQILVTIKQIFKLPEQLKFQNFTTQNIILSRNLFNILINLMADSNNQIRYKAKKIFFKTLCNENFGIVFRYFQESNNIQAVLLFLENCLLQQAEPYFTKYFKMQIITILKKLSLDSFSFQIMSKDQWCFNLFIKVLNSSNSHFKQHDQIMLNCQDDYYVLKGLAEYCQAFNIHFSPLTRQKQQLSYQTIEAIYNILPNLNTINEIKQYFGKLIENLDKYQPLLLKKYLKLIYSSIEEITKCLQQLCILLNNLIKDQQIYHALLPQLLQSLLVDLQQFHQNLEAKKEFIEDTLLIVGTEATYDGCVVTSVYLNSIKNTDRKCKVILKPQLTLLDFEQQVEKGLKVSSPLLYLVINQNHPDKLPYDDFSIIDEQYFKKFKELADQFVDTQFGSVKVPQEIIAVELLRLKMEDYSMKKIYEIITKGSSYYQFMQIQDNKMLWFLENNIETKDKGQLLQSIYYLTKLPYNYIENLFNSINDFFFKRDVQPQYRSILKADFEDYLMDMKIPNSLAKKIATFLAKIGLNNPVDFKDFICFVSLFYQKKQAFLQFSFNETIIVKFTYLLYVDDKGNFGVQQLKNYLENIFNIQNQVIQPEQLQAWANQLFQQIDQNQDGLISFYEYHALLKDPQYRTRLLDPICATFTNLPFESRSNNFFLSSPQRLFGR